MASTSRASITKRDRLDALWGALKSERSSFDAHWKELSDFFVPRRSRFWAGDRNRGDKRNQNIIDSTGRFAARTLASGLHAGLTSPARPWFKLTTPDPDLAEFKPVQEWLEIVTQRMQVIFSSSNLYNWLPVVYGDMGVFGTAAISVLEDTKDLFRATAYPIGSYAIGLDARGLATVFVREYELTVLQVVEQFGVKPGYRDIDWSTISLPVRKAWDDGSYNMPVPLIWIVAPNPDADASLIGSRYLPWTSCHYETGAQTGVFLRDSGFTSFPIMAPRWDITGEDSYGTDCPGMTALGDVKQLQIMHRRKGQAINKMVDPPLVGKPELRTQKTSLLAGDITYVADVEHGLRAIHEVTLNIDHLVRDIGETQYRIQRAFYEDLFLMLARQDDAMGSVQPLTAREVDERHEEKLLALGPVLERTNDELLDPLVDRAYTLMDRAGLIPHPPPELDGVTLKVEYISIMAQAQKLVGVVGQDRFLSSVGSLVEVFPTVRHKIDEFRVVNDYGTMLGVDPRIIRSDDDAQQRADQEAQQQKAAQDAEIAANAAKAAQAAGNTPMGTDSALDRVVGNVAGAMA